MILQWLRVTQGRAIFLLIRKSAPIWPSPESGLPGILNRTDQRLDCTASAGNLTPSVTPTAGATEPLEQPYPVGYKYPVMSADSTSSSPGPSPSLGPIDNVTELLAAHRRGDAGADARLYERVYEELHQLARKTLAGHSNRQADTTSLVHETYLRLAHGGIDQATDRHHMYALAACAMRQILVDRSRRELSQKRGGGNDVALDDALASHARPEHYLAIDQALGQLNDLDSRLRTVVDLHFFVGFSIEEIAGLLSVSERTVRRDWQIARAFLARTLHDGDD